MKTSLSALFVLMAFAYVQCQTVTTLAGNGSAGFTNGSVTVASFASPCGICRDPSGNIYTFEQGNYAVRKITPAGVVSTFAGTGTSGLVNGPGNTAKFGLAFGICSDPSGNIFVADMSNRVIRKITPAGVVSTFAGSGTYGCTDGTGAAALFGYPTGICSDALGNIYVADDGCHKVRKITPGGVVSTYAGSGTPGFANGTGTLATFNSPMGVYADASGNVFVTDHNHAVRKIDPTGLVTTLAGSGTAGSANGTGTLATFNAMYGICGDNSGNIFVAEYNNHMIRKITPAAVVTTFAGTTSGGFANGVGTLASFAFPTGVFFDPQGYLYIADNGNHAIRKITAATASTVSANDPVEIKTEMTLFPNPALGVLNFKCQNPQASSGKLRVMNTLGDMILKQDEFDLSESLDVSGLPGGIYFLNFESEERTTMVKFVKE
jgi:streptogramin lyase